jgi:acetate kinase
VPDPETAARIVTVNGGSSSIKLAIYVAGKEPHRILKAVVERIGDPDPVLTISPEDGSPPIESAMAARDYEAAAHELADWVKETTGGAPLVGIGHRVVHGGISLTEHQMVTREVLDELRNSQLLDPTHLPREISLIEAFQDRFRKAPQVACFDTEFHRKLPRIAQLLPIPRQYLEAGIRRLGFHGLSYTYLLRELRKLKDEAAESGRVILAHLGSGASMVAVKNGKPVDTTMAFTPAAGLMMGTRSGDIDPGLLVHLMRTEKLTPESMDGLISHRCGLLGVSGGSSDVRTLVASRNTDAWAAAALDLFCYQAKKWIGAYVAVLGGLDTIVFSGGIGEHSPEVRAQICDGLETFGVQLDHERNGSSSPIISSPESKAKVRVIPTDEEAVMAKIVFDLARKTESV